MTFSLTFGDVLLTISLIGGLLTAVIKIINNQNTNNTELHVALLEIKYQISSIEMNINRLAENVGKNSEEIQTLYTMLNLMEERLQKLEGEIYGK